MRHCSFMCWYTPSWLILFHARCIILPAGSTKWHAALFFHVLVYAFFSAREGLNPSVHVQSTAAFGAFDLHARDFGREPSVFSPNECWREPSEEWWKHLPSTSSGSQSPKKLRQNARDPGCSWERKCLIWTRALHGPFASIMTPDLLSSWVIVSYERCTKHLLVVGCACLLGGFHKGF